jgi:hypothetical protein
MSAGNAGLNTFRRVKELLKSTSMRKPGWYNAATLIPPQRKPFRVARPQVPDDIAFAVPLTLIVAHRN